jgi:oligopeptidase A
MTPDNTLLRYAREPQAFGGLPPFQDLNATQVVPALRAILEDIKAGQARIEGSVAPTWASAVDQLTDLVEPLERAWGVVGHLMGTKNSDALREAHRTVQPEVVGCGLALAQSLPIFAALKALAVSPEGQALPPARRRILDKKLQEARLAGIELEGEKQQRFNAIEAELSELATTFSNHVLDATKAFSLTITDRARLEGVPSSALAMFAQAARAHGATDATAEAGPWRVTLDFPSFDPVMRYASARELRETLYRAYVARASDVDGGANDNLPLIDRILRLRQEKAKLLGFGSYAELSLATKMAPSVPEVERLLEELRVASFSVAKAELAEIEARAGYAPMHWDVPYFAERIREERYGFSEEELRPYFPLPRVLEGLFSLVHRLFGVTIVEDGAVTWHEDVRYFKLKGADGKDIAAFFLDPYARSAEKRPGAWMDDCVTRRRVGPEVRLPVAYLVCNGTPPVDGQPSLMTFREVETLFHELGHGLQHMLTTVDDVDASGIRGIEWDAVELPSQFMENWCMHERTLLGMTRHVQTQQPLPHEMFLKLKAQKTFRAASMMMRQIAFARVDLELHHRFVPGGDESVLDVQRRLAKETAVMPPLTEDRFLASFTHIFAGGYAAGYYSYKWAEVLSADAFGAFEEAGLDDERRVQETGRRFKETVLARGGSEHPLAVFTAFRGRGPSTEALLRHAGLKAA